MLVVDDEPMLRMVVNEMLSAEGHTVSVAAGGPEASELVVESFKDSAPFDVVIYDIEMPVLNGRMLAEFTETESPKTEVILMTGWADSQIDIDTISTRVIGLLKKSPRLAAITALLAVVARNSAPRSIPTTKTAPRHRHFFAGNDRLAGAPGIADKSLAPAPEYPAHDFPLCLLGTFTDVAQMPCT